MKDIQEVFNEYMRIVKKIKIKHGKCNLERDDLEILEDVAVEYTRFLNKDRR